MNNIQNQNNQQSLSYQKLHQQNNQNNIPFQSNIKQQQIQQLNNILSNQDQIQNNLNHKSIIEEENERERLERIRRESHKLTFDPKKHNPYLKKTQSESVLKINNNNLQEEQQGQINNFKLQNQIQQDQNQQNNDIQQSPYFNKNLQTPTQQINIIHSLKTKNPIKSTINVYESQDSSIENIQPPINKHIYKQSISNSISNNESGQNNSNMTPEDFSKSQDSNLQLSPNTYQKRQSDNSVNRVNQNKKILQRYQSSKNVLNPPLNVSSQTTKSANIQMGTSKNSIMMMSSGFMNNIMSASQFSQNLNLKNQHRLSRSGQNPQQQGYQNNQQMNGSQKQLNGSHQIMNTSNQTKSSNRASFTNNKNIMHTSQMSMNGVMNLLENEKDYPDNYSPNRISIPNQILNESFISHLSQDQQFVINNQYQIQDMDVLTPINQKSPNQANNNNIDKFGQHALFSIEEEKLKDQQKNEETLINQNQPKSQYRNKQYSSQQYSLKQDHSDSKEQNSNIQNTNNSNDSSQRKYVKQKSKSMHLIKFEDNGEMSILTSDSNDSSLSSSQSSNDQIVNLTMLESKKQSILETTVLHTEVDEDGLKIINDYTIFKELGRGAQGKVKLARHDKTEKWVAMKIINKAKLKKKLMQKGSHQEQQLYKEIDILKNLVHPNVVKLIEVIEDPTSDKEKIYMVFEYMKQGAIQSTQYFKAQKRLQEKKMNKMTMSSINMNDSISPNKFAIPKEITNKKIPEFKAKKYYKDLALALDYIHNTCNIIHRDIKPDNLLVDGHDKMKLGDFGVSQIIKQSKKPQQSKIGSWAFLAPECWKKEKISYPIDIWAAGVTLYKLVFGQMPFPSKNQYELEKQICESKVIFPDDQQISTQLKDFINRCLDKNQNTRIKAEEWVVHPWINPDNKLIIKNVSTTDDNDCFNTQILQNIQQNSDMKINLKNLDSSQSLTKESKQNMKDTIQNLVHHKIRLNQVRQTLQQEDDDNIQKQVQQLRNKNSQQLNKY